MGVGRVRGLGGGYRDGGCITCMQNYMNAEQYF